MICGLSSIVRPGEGLSLFLELKRCLQAVEDRRNEQLTDMYSKVLEYPHEEYI
jgi:hypothetical protein